MTWNPEDYKTYWLDHEDDKGGWWEDNFVMARDYEDLLELYKAEIKSKSARVLPFKDGYWVIGEKFSFFAKPPIEIVQEMAKWIAK